MAGRIIRGQAGYPIFVPDELIDPTHVESAEVGRGPEGVRILFYRRSVRVEEAEREQSATFEAVAHVLFPPDIWVQWYEAVKKVFG